jgi:hypothetical protein
LFNALLARQIAQVAPYPFTTIDPHEGVVPLPDERLDKLSEMIKPEKTTPATVIFIDIAGLVKGAHMGEGLGNQFLAKIREVDAIAQVVRAFNNPDVPHYYQTIDAKRDIEIINLELELGGIKKPTIYVSNVGEDQLRKPEIAFEGAIPVCAKLEMELAELEPAERKEYLAQLGIKESGLEKLIKEAYKLLGLITFYTIKGGKETKAWSLKSGQTAIEAAAVVHTDFAKNFIKAEVISYPELLAAGSWQKAQELGKVRLEGKDYVVKDGDVIEFKIGT